MQADSLSQPFFNRLLRALPRGEHHRLLQHGETVHLAFGCQLCEVDKPYQHLYFPLTAFISLVTSLEQRPGLELGLIGHEGMLGATLALGINAAPSRAVVQGSGSALRISAHALRQVLSESAPVRRLLQRYVYVQLAQLSQNAACAHFHELEPRLARWILMTRDRSHSEQLHLTHQFLADMLGVRRSGVTLAAGALQQRQLIRYSRGQITILDRAGLEASACGCYEALRADYSRIFPAASEPP